MTGRVLGQYLCVKEFSEVDYTEDLKKMTIPTLILHGEDDQIFPIGDAAELSVKIAPNARLKVYKGGFPRHVRGQRRSGQRRPAGLH